jgi:hypothetical protein
MRRRFGQALRLGVAHDGIALVRTSRWGAQVSLLAEHAGAPDSAALEALLGEHAGWPLTIVLADELARLWQVTPPKDSTRLADLEAAAALRFQHLYGEPAANWRLSAGWNADRPFLAAALPRALLGVLEQGAAAMPVVEIVPQFIAVFNRWSGTIKPGAWFGVVHDQVLTIGACDGGAFVAVRAQALPDGADAGWLDGHVAREALRLNLPAPSRLQLWGSVPAEWLGSGALACTQLGVAGQTGWASAARLAASGSAA